MKKPKYAYQWPVHNYFELRDWDFVNFTVFLNSTRVYRIYAKKRFPTIKLYQLFKVYCKRFMFENKISTENE